VGGIVTEHACAEIDELEAQTRFDSLLDQVERGAEFIITRHGKPVARLIPPARSDFDDTVAEARSRFADMAPEALQKLIDEAVAATRRQTPPKDDGHMRREDFRIGGTFWSGGRPWRCTDIGTRVITAIQLDHEDDPSWYNGPPYAVAESVFDEYDIEGCTPEPDPDDAVSPPPTPGAVWRKET
jgi:prevent-host-death family protein